MSAAVADTQVRTYLESVRAELDDLPEDDRDELLEDLEEHLLEVAAEDDGTLEQRLGPPADYAEELRASAGLPGRDETLPRSQLAEKLTRSRLWTAGAKLKGSTQYRSFLAFLKELAPGWWVLRGYLGVVALAQITGGVSNDDFPIPYGGTGILLMAGAIALSVWLGRRGQVGRKGRVLSIVLSIAVAAIASGALAGWDSGAYAYYEEQPNPYPGYLSHADGNAIANICPYSSDGTLLSGVVLVDQAGRAIVNTVPQLPDGRQLEPTGPAILNVYPRSLNVVEGFVDIADPITGQTHVEKRVVPLSCPPSVGMPSKPAASPGSASTPGVPSPIPGVTR